MGTKKISYQEAFNQLQNICDRIKEELIPIEQLPAEIQKAKQLVQYCQDLLRKVEEELSDSEEE
jgi:exodeoxyribonuclease VII small subunit